jgi:hypothetical protein
MSTKNYLNAYAAPRVNKFQMGGEMPAEGGQMAPAPQGAPAQGGAPDIEGMLAEYAQSRDPQLAVAICDTLVQMMSAQGGQAPQGAQSMRNGGRMNYTTPMFRKGGRLA